VAKLAAVRADLMKILGDGQAKGFTPANMTAAINYAATEAARITGATKARVTRPLAAYANTSALPTPAIAILHVELVQP